MSSFRAGRFVFLLVPVAVLAIVAFSGFRHSALLSVPDHSLSNNPLVLPPNWPAPPVPADNQITQEKFVLGRQLFYETMLSGDNKTSCATCHNPNLSFSSHGVQAGAFNNTTVPHRIVPRLVNLAYDTVLFWDGHAHTLEEQARMGVLNKGDLQSDTLASFARLANDPAYVLMFTQAFGDGTVTLDRVSKAIATFVRCLVSGNSAYDQYLNGETSAMSASAIRGMKLFFDTNQTNCSECHNNLGSAKPNAPGQIFSDNNYYRTGTFESSQPGGGYGLDTTNDTLHLLDAGRAGVTRDTNDVGKFRTPTLRNVAFMTSFGADGTVTSLAQVIANYNNGGVNRRFDSTPIFNQDPRIQPLHLTDTELNDLAAFLNSLTDTSFISNQAFIDPGPAAVHEDDRTISGDLSVYPNPSANVMNVESPEITGLTEASLISENGATVWRQAANASSRMRLDFTGVPNGVYRLEVISNDTRQTANIVLQR
ncbi:MAG TPA: cytochrome c peroxidase [Candidatus Kapabacteria bacterium]|nr:cytochrome c peroxidase [Candidatus Kapabacteria bacterium]